MNIISEHGFRVDGRRPSQIRNINTRLGLNRNAEGSSYIEHGNTKVALLVSYYVAKVDFLGSLCSIWSV